MPSTKPTLVAAARQGATLDCQSFPWPPAPTHRITARHGAGQGAVSSRYPPYSAVTASASTRALTVGPMSLIAPSWTFPPRCILVRSASGAP